MNLIQKNIVFFRIKGGIRMSDKSDKKNKAPPQLVILLWHHFCYYKRHKIKLLLTILLPFVFISIVYAVQSSLESEQPATCRQYQTTSPMSSGPLQAILSAVCEENSNEGNTMYVSLYVINFCLQI